MNKSAGSAVSYYSDNPELSDPSGERCTDDLCYGAYASNTLCQTCNGQAVRNLKSPWKKTGDLGPQCIRIIPEWMRRVKWCFVCNRDRRASDKHKPDEVTAAVKRLKEKEPNPFLTVEGLSLIVDMCSNN